MVHRPYEVSVTGCVNRLGDLEQSSLRHMFAVIKF